MKMFSKTRERIELSFASTCEAKLVKNGETLKSSKKRPVARKGHSRLEPTQLNNFITRVGSVFHFASMMNTGVTTTNCRKC
jgi:hypothetical protein